jgi:carotenoid cleavage dioxygenase-like enzyme
MGTTLRYSCATDPNPVAEIDPLTYHWFMGDEAGT